MKYYYETEGLSKVRDTLLWRLNTGTHVLLNPGKHCTEVGEYSWGSSVVMFFLLVTSPATSTSHAPGDHASESPGTVPAAAQ